VELSEEASVEPLEQSETSVVWGVACDNLAVGSKG
jgi:hypothetical protein